jgi:hypothetical protein
VNFKVEIFSLASFVARLLTNKALGGLVRVKSSSHLGTSSKAIVVHLENMSQHCYVHMSRGAQCIPFMTYSLSTRIALL